MSRSKVCHFISLIIYPFFSDNPGFHNIYFQIDFRTRSCPRFRHTKQLHTQPDALSLYWSCCSFLLRLSIKYTFCYDKLNLLEKKIRISVYIKCYVQFCSLVSISEFLRCDNLFEFHKLFLLEGFFLSFKVFFFFTGFLFP